MEIRDVSKQVHWQGQESIQSSVKKQEPTKDSQSLPIHIQIDEKISEFLETDSQLNEKIVSMLETWQLPVSKEYRELANFLLGKEWPLTMDNVQLFHQAFFLMGKDIEAAFFILENQLVLNKNLPLDIDNLMQKENLLGDLLVDLTGGLLDLPDYLQSDIQGYIDLIKPMRLAESHMNSEPNSWVNRGDNWGDIDLLFGELSQKILDYFIAADINPLDMVKAPIGAEIKQLISMGVASILEDHLLATGPVVEAKQVVDRKQVSEADFDKRQADSIQIIERNILNLFDTRANVPTNVQFANSFRSSFEKDIEKIIKMFIDIDIDIDRDIDGMADKLSKKEFIHHQARESHQKQSGEGMKELVKNYFRQIKETTQQTRNILKRWEGEEDPETREHLLSTVETIDRKIGYLDQLRQLTYLQLPIQMNHQVVDTEIYLFNKDKQPSKHLISAVITMNFDNMGYVEAFIIRDKDKVSGEFRTQSPEGVQMLQGDLLHLQQQLVNLSLSLEQWQVNVLEVPFNLAQGNPFQTINQKKAFQGFQQDV